MSLLFSDLQAEVKRRATRDQSGGEFTEAVKNAINLALFRISRDAPWRVLRREASFNTETSYTTGTGAVTVTANSTTVTVTGATFITSNIRIGRLVKLGGSNLTYKIVSINSETSMTVDRVYDGTTSSTQSYQVLPTFEYNLPVQASHRMSLWHRQWGYPFLMQYMTEGNFREMSIDDTVVGIPWLYRMWGDDMAIEQPYTASALTIVSSSSADTSCQITIFGTVAGYPDYETINLNGTSAAAGSKSFTNVERVVKSASTTGRVTITSNSGNVTVAVLPVGDTTSSVLYRKVKIWPLPDSIFPMNVLYYKDPWRLVNDGDIHELGQEFDEAIICLAVAKIKYESSQAEGDKFMALFEDERRSLRRTNMDKPDWNPSLRRPGSATRRNGLMTRGLSYSQLGGYYGPSSR